MTVGFLVLGKITGGAICVWLMSWCAGASALGGQHLRNPPFVTSQWSLFREAWPLSFALGLGVVTF